MLASYGGGHAEIIARVASALSQTGADVDLIGFTTARAVFERKGLPCKSVTALLEPEDSKYLTLVEPLLPESTHPDVTCAETHAYFALGMKSLVEDMGETRALEILRAEGRTAFLPVSVFRRYLEKTTPDMVISTTSPRFELALLRAARKAQIPSVAIGDLFLLSAFSWIKEPNYAEHLFVLSDHVRELALDAGVTDTQIHITGNPVFDMLHDRNESIILRNNLRQSIGVASKRVILWPATGAEMSMIGRPFLPVAEVIAFLVEYCADRPDTIFLVRPHPNTPITDLVLPSNGQMAPEEWTIEDCILASDHVLVEVSTVGLQAALTGLPVTVVGFGDYVIYPQLGLGEAVLDLAEATRSLDTYSGPDLSGDKMPPIGRALETVLQKIEELFRVSKRDRI